MFILKSTSVSRENYKILKLKNEIFKNNYDEQEELKKTVKELESEQKDIKNKIKKTKSKEEIQQWENKHKLLENKINQLKLGYEMNYNSFLELIKNKEQFLILKNYFEKEDRVQFALIENKKDSILNIKIPDSFSYFLCSFKDFNNIFHIGKEDLKLFIKKSKKLNDYNIKTGKYTHYSKILIPGQFSDLNLISLKNFLFDSDLINKNVLEKNGPEVITLYLIQTSKKQRSDIDKLNFARKDLKEFDGLNCISIEFLKNKFEETFYIPREKQSANLNIIPKKPFTVEDFKLINTKQTPFFIKFNENANFVKNLDFCTQSVQQLNSSTFLIDGIWVKNPIVDVNSHCNLDFQINLDNIINFQKKIKKTLEKVGGAHKVKKTKRRLVILLSLTIIITTCFVLNSIIKYYKNE